MERPVEPDMATTVPASTALPTDTICVGHLRGRFYFFMKNIQVTQCEKGIDLFGGVVMFQENGSVIIRIAVVVAEYRQVLDITYLLCDNTPHAYLYPSHRHALIRLFLIVLQWSGILLTVEVIQDIICLLTDSGIIS